jgi:hypothetical protein
VTSELRGQVRTIKTNDRPNFAQLESGREAESGPLKKSTIMTLWLRGSTFLRYGTKKKKRILFTYMNRQRFRMGREGTFSLERARLR